jgi:uncharacterized protein YecE (DUF72 family)
MKKNPARGRSRDWVRFGTSSFASADWVGPFYPERTKPGEYLSFYAKHYDTVEIDATYYRVPEPRTFDAWAAATPDGFLFSLKFPKSIVHGGSGATPDGRKLLVPEATHRERDRFLDATLRLGKKCGPLVLQFPYLARRVLASQAEFEDRLDQFLGGLPAGRRYAVEIRNRSWLSESFTALCRRHRSALVTVDQAWMPRPWELSAGPSLVTTDFTYARLIGDRKEIESLTTVWDREIIDRGPLLKQWADYLAGLTAHRLPALVYVNNHFAGFAPGTIERLKHLYQRCLEK